MPIPKTVPEKLNILLRTLAKVTPIPGAWAQFDGEKDYPLVFAQEPSEVYYLVGQLAERKFVSGSGVIYVITADGYEKLEQLDALSYKSTRNAFVAMWFHKSRD